MAEQNLFQISFFSKKKNRGRPPAPSPCTLLGASRECGLWLLLLRLLGSSLLCGFFLCGSFFSRFLYRHSRVLLSLFVMGLLWAHAGVIPFELFPTHLGTLNIEYTHNIWYVNR